jgi:disulfide bond formation protein DsbB
MMRYATVPWPWAGLAAVLIVLGQEGLQRLLGDAPSLAMTSWRILLLTIGVVCLVLILLPPRRPAYLLGAATCAGLMGWALWLQYGLGLDPCPLCSLQRMVVVAIGVVFLIAGIHNPRRVGAAVYAGLTVILGLFGAVTAMRHVWIQSLPKGDVPECGMGLNYMLETMPLTDVLSKVFKGSGECSEIGWTFLGLSIPGWTLIFFIAMIVAALVLIRRD